MQISTLLRTPKVMLDLAILDTVCKVYEKVMGYDYSPSKVNFPFKAGYNLCEIWNHRIGVINEFLRYRDDPTLWHMSLALQDDPPSFKQAQERAVDAYLLSVIRMMEDTTASGPTVLAGLVDLTDGQSQGVARIGLLALWGAGFPELIAAPPVAMPDKQAYQELHRSFLACMARAYGRADDAGKQRPMKGPALQGEAKTEDEKLEAAARQHITDHKCEYYEASSHGMGRSIECALAFMHAVTEYEFMCAALVARDKDKPWGLTWLSQQKDLLRDVMRIATGIAAAKDLVGVGNRGSRGLRAFALHHVWPVRTTNQELESAFSSVSFWAHTNMTPDEAGRRLRWANNVVYPSRPEGKFRVTGTKRDGSKSKTQHYHDTISWE